MLHVLCSYCVYMCVLPQVGLSGMHEKWVHSRYCGTDAVGHFLLSLTLSEKQAMLMSPDSALPLILTA